MKKNFLTAAAVMVTALLLATTVAQASDVTFGGEFWTRYELLERNDFDDSTNSDKYVQTRMRLNANVNVNESTSAFIQLQSNRTWGDRFEAAGSGADPAGNSTAGSFDANDLDASVGIHQAYFTLKNVVGLPVDAKTGRQEIIIDGHRIFGNTLWTMGANSHDAVRLDHKRNNMSFSYAYIKGSEESRAQDDQDNDDVDVQMAYMNYAGILGGKLSVLYAYMDDGCGVAVASVCNEAADDIHTLGFRQAGQLYGIDYRGEYYYQWGDADATANQTNVNGGYTAGNPIDRDAYMFGVRVGKSFNNVTMKPGITLWYDYLSGTTDRDAQNNEWKSFNTIFDTGHKFYGLQDVFLGIGNNSAAGGTAGFGLQDLAIKAKLSPIPGWLIKADYHFFFTAERMAGSPNRGTVGEATACTLCEQWTQRGASNLGQELDITAVHKYNANTKVQLGFSNYQTTETFRLLRTNVGSAPSANWFYAQVHVGF